jgi:acyl carrier protein
MIIWPVVFYVSLLSLVTLWLYQSLPRWRAARSRARREPLAEEQFGKRYFTAEQSQIAVRLRGIAAKQLGKDQSRLHPDDRLAQIWFDQSDSLDSVELLMAIEEEFGIELDDATAISVETFRDLVNAVTARQPFLVKWRRELGRAIEGQFGVSLTREALAKIATPLEAVEAVAAELKGQLESEKHCQTQRAFYLLRNAMTRTLHVPRNLVTPMTPLRTLIRRRSARSAWPQLRDAVAARNWPALGRPRWARWLVVSLPVLLGAGVGFGLPPLADWAVSEGSTIGIVMSFISELRSLVVIAVVALSWALLLFSKPLSSGFPPGVRTVGDLLPFVITSEQMRWTCDQIEEKFRKVVVDQLRLTNGQYRTGGRFVEDFGLAALVSH